MINPLLRRSILAASALAVLTLPAVAQSDAAFASALGVIPSGLATMAQLKTVSQIPAGATVQIQTPAASDEDLRARIQTREQLKQVLAREGPALHVNFQQSQTDPFYVFGFLNTGLAYAEWLEIVVSIDHNLTIAFRIYPHYKGSYINVDKVKDKAGLMRQLLLLNRDGFFHWGIDSSGDVFARYNFTLESGFPAESIRIVLLSIPNNDQTIGKMVPMIEGGGLPGA